MAPRPKGTRIEAADRDVWVENRRLLAVTARKLWRLLASWTAPLRALALERAVELAVVAAVLINAALFLTFSGNLRNSAGRYTTACDDHALLFQDHSLSMITSATYYPPFHYVWMALCPWATFPVSPPALLLWSNLLIVPAWFGVSSALRRVGARREARWAAALLLAGFPLSVVFSCTLHSESAMLGFSGLLLWCLCGYRQTPSGLRCVALGTILGLAMLCKWTFVLFAAGPLLLTALRLAAVQRSWKVWLRCAALVAVPAAVIAAPWYLFILDWGRLAATVENDPVFHGLTGWERHFEAYKVMAGHVVTALGTYLLAPVAVGIAIAVWKRLPGTWTALSSALVPLLFLPTLPHFEERYLLGALPGIALAAGLGLGSMERRRSSAVVALVLAAALWQGAVTTWSGAFKPRPRGHPGPVGACAPDFTLYWARPEMVEKVRNRVWFWSRQLLMHDEPRYCVHPFEANPDLRVELLSYLEMREGRTPRPPFNLGYDFSTYVPFFRDIYAGTTEFLLVSQETLAADDHSLRYWATNGWHFIPLTGSETPLPQPQPPEDPLLLDLINRKYGVAETFYDDDRAIFIMVRRDIWHNARMNWPLCGLPSRLRLR